MEFVILFMVAAFAAGYAFRGAIGREVKKLGTELAAVQAKDTADFKAEIAKFVTDLKAKL